MGVLGGAEKLSPVVERDERRRMQVFGYLDSNEDRPLIRLACQAKAHGAVSIVIPPWNGVFGRTRRCARASEGGQLPFDALANLVQVARFAGALQFFDGLAAEHLTEPIGEARIAATHRP